MTTSTLNENSRTSASQVPKLSQTPFKFKITAFRSGFLITGNIINTVITSEKKLIVAYCNYDLRLLSFMTFLSLRHKQRQHCRPTEARGGHGMNLPSICMKSKKFWRGFEVIIKPCMLICRWKAIIIVFPICGVI